MAVHERLHPCRDPRGEPCQQPRIRFVVQARFRRRGEQVTDHALGHHQPCRQHAADAVGGPGTPAAIERRIGHGQGRLVADRGRRVEHLARHDQRRPAPQRALVVLVEPIALIGRGAGDQDLEPLEREEQAQCVAHLARKGARRARRRRGAPQTLEGACLLGGGNEGPCRACEPCDGRGDVSRQRFQAVHRGGVVGVGCERADQCQAHVAAAQAHRATERRAVAGVEQQLLLQPQQRRRNARRGQRHPHVVGGEGLRPHQPRSAVVGVGPERQQVVLQLDADDVAQRVEPRREHRRILQRFVRPRHRHQQHRFGQHVGRTEVVVGEDRGHTGQGAYAMPCRRDP
ncbi:MAG: hypothetical protein MUC69_03515 [Gemmatimonadales bacterium]|nr:hypothetical protein [Gemmatimonadales bacterium]